MLPKRIVTTLAQTRPLALLLGSLLLLGVSALFTYASLRYSLYTSVEKNLDRVAVQIEEHPTHYPLESRPDISDIPWIADQEITVFVMRSHAADEKPLYQILEYGGKVYLEAQYPYVKDPEGNLLITQEITSTYETLKMAQFSLILSTAFVLVLLALGLFLIKEALQQSARPEHSTTQQSPAHRKRGRQRQQEIITGIAHELKTPLAVIKAKAEMTLMRERAKEQYIEALQSTVQVVDNMNATIKSIMSLGELESLLATQPEQFDLIVFLDKLARDMALLAAQEKKKLSIELEPSHLTLQSQPALFQQIFQNLIQNAIKFTPSGKTITIRSKLNSQDHWILEVVDEGQGLQGNIDPFAPFKRFGKESGIGLGLFLAKNATDILGGTIKLENRKDDKEGAIATLELNLNLLKI